MQLSAAETATTVAFCTDEPFRNASRMSSETASPDIADQSGRGVVGRGPRPLDEKKLSLWEQYVVANKRRPLETKCITTGACACAGA